MKKISSLFLVVAIFICICLLFFLTKTKVSAVHSGENLPFESSQSFMPYVPSPYEFSMIQENKDIWPRRFSRKMPPTLTDLPVIYYSFQKAHPRDKKEIDFFRSLAMTANLEEWNAFRDILSFRLQLKKGTVVTPKSLLQWVKAEKCSVFAQDIAYRLLQWQPDFLPEVSSYYQSCDSDSFHSFWLKILIEQKSKDFEKLKNLLSAIQSRREKLSNESYEEYVLTQAFNALDLRLAHEFKQQNQ